MILKVNVCLSLLQKLFSKTRFISVQGGSHYFENKREIDTIYGMQ